VVGPPRKRSIVSWIRRLAGSRQVVRIGANAVELWQVAGSSHERVAHRALEERVSLYSAGELSEALEVTAGSIRGRLADLVVESALAPVLLVRMGAFWRPKHVLALLRHRLNESFSDAPEPIASWDLRAAHRAGDAVALAYGLPSEMKALIEASLKRAGRRVASIEPALHWSLRTARPWREWSGGSGMWIWREQDRSIVAMLDSGRVKWVHQAAEPSFRGEQVALELAPMPGAADLPSATGEWGALMRGDRARNLQSAQDERSLASLVAPA
jgi:hypothetical protein